MGAVPHGPEKNRQTAGEGKRGKIRTKRTVYTCFPVAKFGRSQESGAQDFFRSREQRKQKTNNNKRRRKRGQETKRRQRSAGGCRSWRKGKNGRGKSERKGTAATIETQSRSRMDRKYGTDPFPRKEMPEEQTRGAKKKLVAKNRDHEQSVPS